MFLDGRPLSSQISGHLKDTHHHIITPQHDNAKLPQLEWDWEREHADRKLEAKADVALHGSIPFQVDRKVLKDVVRERIGVEVGNIKFLSSGTFHQAYLITLANHTELVARVARRFMPRLKTESEVATMRFLREHTDVPVPIVYHYDANPYNRLGGEYILMSKAPGIPLGKVFHSLGYNDLVKLCNNFAAIIIPLFALRFSEIGSLYSGPNPRNGAGLATISPSSAATPKASDFQHPLYLSSTPTLTRSFSSVLLEKTQQLQKPKAEFHVGQIVSWPFFGSNRGELSHPSEISRGPWSSTLDYLASCADREIEGVIRENEGRSAPHRLHLDPDEILSSRHHQMKAVPGDESDDSDEWDLEESEEEWEGPGDAMYRDYRRMQRSTFLVAHLTQREECVRKEMARWMVLMKRLMKLVKEDVPEQFGLDCHDLSLENVFVDEEDPSKITCIIDWESTTIRPLWACAHLPAFVQSSPFTARLFRQAVADFATNPTISPTSKHHNRTYHHHHHHHHYNGDLSVVAKEWLYYEQAGMRLREAHRFVEWDGWEEGLVDSMLGPEEVEEEWFHESGSSVGGEAGGGGGGGRNGMGKRGVGMMGGAGALSPHMHHHHHHQLQSMGGLSGVVGSFSTSASILVPLGGNGNGIGRRTNNNNNNGGGVKRAGGIVSTSTNPVVAPAPLPFTQEKEREKMLNTTGDICGGRGGELGRRLEAWLTVSGRSGGKDEEVGGLVMKKWSVALDEEGGGGGEGEEGGYLGDMGGEEFS
ncbi:hypothetical protein AMATHDRAFT_184595 [Amanita thiersii Skay4041]|uniref:Aminoglycoside phosphotransferase domain-containing protein n=1 Tax=Amanita thiersii Skay4041 TaxID=703135 RepID=A0A2A9NAZ9_9AGAR|nr:hypothetical protein AMATHDRAFT_184595 [Amanita thiersii Skay4041]